MYNANIVDIVEVSNKQEQQFLYLTTTGWRTGREHRIQIWFVIYADKYHIISEREKNSQFKSHV